MSAIEVADESSRGGNDDVGSQFESFALLFKADTVVAAIDGDGRHTVQIVGKSFHLLVYLLSQFSGWRHDDAIDGVFRIIAVAQFVEHGQQVGGRLSCASLCNAHQVSSLQNLGNGLFLDRGAFLKVHGIECVKQLV